MKYNILNEYTVGDTLCRYLRDEDSGRVSLQLFPASTATQVQPERGAVVSLGQIKLRGDGYSSGFGAGLTMRNSETMEKFHFLRQQQIDNKIVTTLHDPERNLYLHHTLGWQNPTGVFSCQVEFVNASASEHTLEMIESFSLSGLSPYSADESIERLYLHRFRSRWSSEARHVIDPIEDLHLERVWAPYVIMSERFGSVGTFPVRNWHPFVALEDRQAGVFWGAQLAWAGSWQMELFRGEANGFTLSGGLADYEFGQWAKVIKPGESFQSPPAYIACCQGDFDDLCQQLLLTQEQQLSLPAVEEELPIIFNEWCASWGKPNEQVILKYADKLAGTPCRYLVMDDGWARHDDDKPYTLGDWQVNTKHFPHGLNYLTDEIRKRGLIPGIWFEMENVGKNSAAFHDHIAHQLQFHGQPIYTTRHIWNLRDAWAVAYIQRRVINPIHDWGFGYVKIDYNETAGIGSDHADSPGEGIRCQVEGTSELFRKLRERNRELVIENCASGGHRLEPSMFALSSMSSFSDAHTAKEIPIIAANVLRLMLPRQCQIWAVMMPEMTEREMIYHLTAAMMGRLCISGKILDLSETQWQTAVKAMEYYRTLVPVLKQGTSKLVREHANRSRRRPQGTQIWQRIQTGGAGNMMYVLHAFENAATEESLELPSGDWEIVSNFGQAEVKLQKGCLVWNGVTDFSGHVVLLQNGRK